MTCHTALDENAEIMDIVEGIRVGKYIFHSVFYAKQHGSVVLEPHLDMKDKESLAPMHAPQGIFYHLGANKQKSIRQV